MNVLETLNKIGYLDLKSTPTHWQTRPLYRDSDNETALVIDKKTGLFYDFVQKVGGTLSQLVSISTGLKTQKEIEDFLGSQITVATEQNYELGEAKKFSKDLLLKLRKDHSYWVNRGVSEKTVSIFEGGIATHGKMANRYVFPIFNIKDEIVGFSGRALDGFNTTRWKLIGAKSNWLYPVKWNKDILQRTKEVILLESVGDALSMWDNGIENILVTFGVNISASVIEFLLKIDSQRILIAFNNDDKKNLVGNNAAEHERVKLLKYFDANQVVIAVPNYKDFGEMDAEQIEQWRIKYNI